MLGTGAFIAVTKRYREVLWLGWAFYIAAMGALSTLTVDSTVAQSTGFSVLLSWCLLLYPLSLILQS